MKILENPFKIRNLTTKSRGLSKQLQICDFSDSRIVSPNDDLFQVNSFLIAITNSFKDSWLKKAKNNYVRTYVSSKESLTTTTSIKWDTLILCVSYLSLYLASSRTGRIDIVDRPRCTGTISTVRYKHIQTCSQTTDGDRYTLIWYPVLLSHIYFVRFKNLAKGFIRHPAF